MRDGKPTVASRIVVDKDGKTMTITRKVEGDEHALSATGFYGNNQKLLDVSIYERE